MKDGALSSQRFVNALRSVLGKSPLYSLPVRPGARVLVAYGHGQSRHEVPARVMSDSGRGYFEVCVEGRGVEVVHDGRIRLLEEL